MPDLPQELHDYIMEQLALDRDRATLSACTRVCKAWLPYSTRLLFRDRVIVTHNLAQLEALSAALGVRHARARLSRHITAVRMHLAHPPKYNVWMTLVLVYIHDVLSRLPRIEELSVYGNQEVDDTLLQQMPPGSWRDFVPPLARPFKRLFVSRLGIPMTDALLGMFSVVETLEVRRWSPQWHTDVITSRHTVKRLVVSYTFHETITNVVRVIHLPALSTLTIDVPALSVFTIDDLPALPRIVNALLRYVGRHISHFEFNERLCFDSHTPEDRAAAFPALATSSALRTVSLHVPIVGLRVGHPPPAWQQAVSLLHAVPTHVAHIALAATVVPVRTGRIARRLARVLDWPRLDAALARHANAAVALVLRVDWPKGAQAEEYGADDVWLELWDGAAQLEQDIRDAVLARLSPALAMRMDLTVEIC